MGVAGGKGPPQKNSQQHKWETRQGFKEPEGEQIYEALFQKRSRRVAETVKSDSATFAKVIKDAGIKMEVN